MGDSEDIAELVQRLKDLQVEQAAMIVKIQAAEKRRATLNTAEFSPGDKVVITNKTNPPSGVRPSPQDKTGEVISVTPKRVRVRTDSGVITSRAPQNLTKILSP